MEKKVVRFGYNHTDLYKKALQIRKVVFVDEQKVSLDIEIDEFEEECVYFLAFVDDKAAGTSRYRITDKGVKLERFAVLQEFRKYGIGKLLIEEMLKEVSALKLDIYLNSQDRVVDFYKKYGFEVVGDSFYEANILHYKMIHNINKKV